MRGDFVHIESRFSTDMGRLSTFRTAATATHDRREALRATPSDPLGVPFRLVNRVMGAVAVKDVSADVTVVGVSAAPLRR